jgi:hypothetical protein
VVFYVDAAELAGRPIGECAGEHERVTEVRDLLGLRSEVVASGDLVAEVAELPETRLREVCPELGRVEVAHTTRDGSLNHPGLKPHRPVSHKGEDDVETCMQ